MVERHELNYYGLGMFFLVYLPAIDGLLNLMEYFKSKNDLDGYNKSQKYYTMMSGKFDIAHSKKYKYPHGFWNFMKNNEKILNEMSSTTPIMTTLIKYKYKY